MAKIEVNRVTNANVYLNGNSLLGRAREIELPEVTHQMAEHEGMGLYGSPEFPSGLEAMEASITWAAFYKDVLEAAGNPFEVVRLQIRTSVDTFTGQGLTSQVPLVCHLRGVFKNHPLGTFKKGENVELGHQLTIYYFKQVFDGEDVLEVDVLENVMKRRGEDLLAQWRTNLGA